MVGTENLNTSGIYEAYIYHGGDTTLDTKIESANKFVAGNGIGDINGDGFDDFALSIDNGANVTTYAIYGSSSLPANLTLADLNNPLNAQKITHNINLGSRDYTISAVGDKDGDGFDDFQIGIVNGQQFTVHGKSSGNVVQDQQAGDGDVNIGDISATASNQSLVGNGNFSDGSNNNISMKGGSGNNEFLVNNSLFNNIDGGTGIDTIEIGANLNFTNINFEKISQIEKIDITGSNQLILTEENIFNLLKSSDNNELFITGNVGSSLAIDSTASGATVIDKVNNTLGSTHAAQTIDGVNYDVFTVGVYNLYVEQTDVTVSVI